MRNLFKVFLILTIFFPLFSHAALLEDLKNKILDRNNEVQKLEAEIKIFQKELEVTKKEAGSLQGEIQKIDTTSRKLSNDIKQTEKTISVTNSNISTIAGEIEKANQAIVSDRLILAEAIKSLREKDDLGLIEILLSGNTFSDMVNEIDTLDRLGQNIVTTIKSLESIKIELGEKKQSAESERVKLSGLKSQLADQKHLVDQTKSEKDKLLQLTKSREVNYQKLLADRIAKKQSVESEIASIEQQIKKAIDPNKLPDVGSGVLSWPLAKVIITQYFGFTEFATKNPQIYNGKGHNGIDMGAPIGTNLLASADGTVAGVGDTDLTCMGASYGKWILVRHNNGLASLYAHLSMIKVTEGQTVSRGQIIGYTGKSGYSTGPHLHYTVLANEGVQVRQLQSKVPGCGIYTIPIASHSSYLNPLSFLTSK